MKKVIVVAPFASLPGEGRNNKFGYLCDRLTETGITVELMTSEFNHFKKAHRDKHHLNYSDKYKTSLIYEPGYKKNISLKRLYSHYIFSRNLKSALENLEYKPDIIYCTVPTPDASVVAGKYAKQLDIPFVIDVQDIWPEAMRLIIDIPVISDIGFMPLKRKVDNAYSMADAIIAVSDTYLNRALSVNKHSKSNLTVFIGTDLDYFDRVAEENFGCIKKTDDEFWVTYVGTLGHSYDIETLISAVKLMHQKGYNNIRLMILGTGPLKEGFEDFAAREEVNATFTGFLNYSLMTGYLKKSNIAVNAIKRKAVQSIINKISDYVSAGLPVLNGSLNPEFCGMVEKEKIGLNYEPENPESLAEKLELLYLDRAMRQRMGINARALAERRFDRKKTYTGIIELLKGL